MIESCTVLFAGDVAFGENYQERIEANGGADMLKLRGYRSMLDGVRRVIEQADLVVVNLAAPLTEPGRAPADGKKRYVHRGDPRRTVAVLADHRVAAVSLANRNVLDYGAAGLRSTLAALAKRGVESFGAGLHAAEAARPWRRVLEVGDAAVGLTVVGGVQQAGGKDLAAGATDGGAVVQGWSRLRAAHQIGALRATVPDDLIVAFPAWGRAYRPHAERQARLARTLIEAGADLVLGHGSHMLGAVERYRDRWIVYGLGNFAFGSPGRYAKVPGAIPFSVAVALELRREAEGVACTLRLYPLLTDNIATEYCPSPVTAEELNTIEKALAKAGNGTTPPWSRDDVTPGPTLLLPMGTLPLTGRFHRTGRLDALAPITRNSWTSESSPRSL